MRDDAVLGRALPLGWETLRGEAGEKVHRVHRTCRSIGVGDTKTKYDNRHVITTFNENSTYNDLPYAALPIGRHITVCLFVCLSVCLSHMPARNDGDNLIT